MGVDVRLRCLKCQRQLLLERVVFERRVKTVVSKLETKDRL